MSSVPDQDLTCPDPEHCAVAVERLADLASHGRLRMQTFPAQHSWFRIYDAVDGYADRNPGFGDSRFAPFDTLADGARVPTLYLAETLEAALLETSLHDVAVQQPRVVPEAALHGKLHARVLPPAPLHLIDLRDYQLHELGLTRPGIASSSPEHYPCTRRAARAVHASVGSAQGIVWHSRQSELNGVRPTDVAVVFADRVTTARGAWRLARSPVASGALLEGVGRLLLDELAEALDVTIVGSEEG